MPCAKQWACRWNKIRSKTYGATPIELAKSFVPKLDECYRLASLTSVLDGAPELAKQGANANELIIPMMSMDGLADYSRNGGYVQGGVTMTNRDGQVQL